MNGLPYGVTNKERAHNDVRIMLVSTSMVDGKPQFRKFASIQRQVHAERIENLPPYRIDSKLIGYRKGDVNSLLRAVAAYCDPRLLPGYDYEDVPDYSRMLDQIINNPTLANASPGELYDFSIRGTKRAKGADSILAIASGVYVARRRVLIPGFDTRQPDPPPAPPTPTPPPEPLAKVKEKAVSVRKTKFLEQTAQTASVSADRMKEQATRYLETVSASDYEITRAELSTTKALTKLTQSEQAAYTYDRTPAEFAQYLHDRNNTYSFTTIHNLVKDASLKIPRLLGVAMATRELHGVLPPGSPNMDQLIRYLENYSIETPGGTIRPYLNLAASSLRMVLIRNISAADLLRLDALRGGRSYLKELGEALEAQKI